MKVNKNRNANPRTGSRIIWVTLLVFLVAPHIISTPLMTEIMIFGLFALGFNLLLGHTGILSFGHAAYFGLGCTDVEWPSVISACRFGRGFL